MLEKKSVRLAINLTDWHPCISMALNPCWALSTPLSFCQLAVVRFLLHCLQQLFHFSTTVLMFSLPLLLTDCFLLPHQKTEANKHYVAHFPSLLLPLVYMHTGLDFLPQDKGVTLPVQIQLLTLISGPRQKHLHFGQ